MIHSLNISPTHYKLQWQSFGESLVKISISHKVILTECPRNESYIYTLKPMLCRIKKLYAGSVF